MTGGADGDGVALRDGLPSPEDFIAFRAAAGWGRVAPEAARRALAGSLFGIVAEEADGALAGFGRVVGDGALNLYLQDVIVREDLRGVGLGARLAGALAERAMARLAPGGALGLLSAVAAEGLYARLGFASRPAPGYGPGMSRFAPPPDEA
ncbi:MAG: GNAT family N-acetyltransferase [Pseudomonadota bacterium]